MVQPSGWKGVWHRESKVDWIVTLAGKWFVEAMEGTRVELGPGDVSLGEDQNTLLRMPKAARATARAISAMRR